MDVFRGYPYICVTILSIHQKKQGFASNFAEVCVTM